MKKKIEFSQEDLDRIVEMAWEDRTPFDAIELQFGIKEQIVIEIMRSEMKKSSFKMWRKRVQNRKTKHSSKSYKESMRFRSKSQKVISQNKISKR